MGAVIKSIAICDRYPDSAIENATGAGLQCLQEIEYGPGDVDLLINVGVYREDNIMEPSIASLIQQKMGVNPDPAREDIRRRTLSFDLANGACGFLNAVEIASSALARGQVKTALIVSADLHPSRQKGMFPFTNLGAAVLLEQDPNPERGFSRVYARSNAESTFWGYKTHGALADFGNRGREHAVFTKQEDYPARFCEFVVESAQLCMIGERLRPGELDALITAQLVTGFPSLVAEAVGVQSDCRVPDLYADWGDAHSSSAILCLHQLWWEHCLVPGKRLLIASVSAGISSTCAVYRV